MTFFPDGQTFVAFGSLSIKWYAITMIGGAFVTYLLSLKEFKKCGYERDRLDDIFLGCFISGVVGARLWYCLIFDPVYYFSNPMHLLATREGGLAIQGGLVFGALFGIWYCRRHKMSFLRVADIIIPGILIAQAIGRWGNFINQEAYGNIVNESFFNLFPAFIKNGMFIDGAYRFPAFLLESVLNLIGYLLIIFVYKKYCKPKRGYLICAYLIWYGVVRFIVEFNRTDALMFMGMRMAQVLSICAFFIGLFGIVGGFNKLIKVKKPVILFDLDGTLLDTEPAIIETYRYLFKKYRKEEDFDKEKQIEVLGPPLAAMFPKYFPDQNTDDLIKEYREYNFKIHPEFVKPMENAKEILSYLKENNYKIGVVSTKFSDGVKLGLDLFELTQYVDVIVGHENVEKGKPSPEGILKACKDLNEGHDSCIYVGDSVTDIQAAYNAGVYSIGYIFKPERKEMLENSKPNKTIDNLIDIKEILKGDNQWTYNMM